MFGLPDARARPSDLERDDRQPRGAVGRARARARHGGRALRGRPLHARAHVPGARRRVAGRARADPDGRVDLDAVAAEVRARRRRDGRAHPRHDRASAPSTTSDAALALKERHGVRLHVDGAYGGFFALLGGARRLRRRSAACDSVVVDPHKHGLQPYGCGAVLFADPAVGALLPARLALHVLHLGRAAPGRDLARVLARGRGRRRPVADAAGVPARARPGPRRGPRRPAGGRRSTLAGRLRGSERLRLHVEPGARHRHLLAAAAPG